MNNVSAVTSEFSLTVIFPERREIGISIERPLIRWALDKNEANFIHSYKELETRFSEESRNSVIN
jgi:hypothetical protein